MTKYALIGLLAVCATVLCFSLIFRERLCELNIHRGNTVVQVTLAYEARKSPLSGSARYFRGRHPIYQKQPVPWLRHFQLFSHFIIKITLNGRNQT